MPKAFSLPCKSVVLRLADGNMSVMAMGSQVILGLSDLKQADKDAC